ncbi:MAG: cbb3-type cytochrome c oxidase subunit II [Opitutales bacterium]|nr:cbb3-type cytochrome c oxidase subunit II [Opitutales bacterium]
MMKNFYTLFFGFFAALAFSFTGLIISSEIQLGGLQPTTPALMDDEGNQISGTTFFKPLVEGGEMIERPGLLMEGEPMYPQEPLGLAQLGKQVYMSQGCMYCHSQQVRRKGFGADQDRLWGERQSVARDYILQDRVLLGTMRTGPDLKNVGDRGISADDGQWHYQHLYNPQLTSVGSTMPPYRYLFELKPIVDGTPEPDAVQIPSDSPDAPPAGMQVVPKMEARALVAYLKSLRLNYALPEAPFQE